MFQFFHEHILFPLYNINNNIERRTKTIHILQTTTTTATKQLNCFTQNDRQTERTNVRRFKSCKRKNDERIMVQMPSHGTSCEFQVWWLANFSKKYICMERWTRDGGSSHEKEEATEQKFIFNEDIMTYEQYH